MSRPVVLDPEAQAEFDDGYDFYEARRAGLGGAFADAVEAVVRGFPYCVYYLEEPTQVRAISVFHARRDPTIWQ